MELTAVPILHLLVRIEEQINRDAVMGQGISGQTGLERLQ
jgi:hypothetical protein